MRTGQGGECTNSCSPGGLVQGLAHHPAGAFAQEHFAHPGQVKAAVINQAAHHQTGHWPGEKQSQEA